MNLGNRTITPELWITAILLVLAVLSLLFLGALVAPPKVLLGRSLTAIEPALFPSLILTLLAMLCAIQIAATLRRDEQGTESDGMLNGWRRGAILFLIMTFYALAMEPFGFLISTAISVAAMAGFDWQSIDTTNAGHVLYFSDCTVSDRNPGPGRFLAGAECNRICLFTDIGIVNHETNLQIPEPS